MVGLILDASANAYYSLWMGIIGAAFQEDLFKYWGPFAALFLLLTALNKITHRFGLSSKFDIVREIKRSRNQEMEDRLMGAAIDEIEGSGGHVPLSWEQYKIRNQERRQRIVNRSARLRQNRRKRRKKKQGWNIP